MSIFIPDPFTVTYTRGKDLNGSLQRAGGIGGLLARWDCATRQAAFYHADGNGNVTAMINSLQFIVAKYLYDPYGSILSMSGPLAGVNLYRFSSKEYEQNSDLVYYLLRFYDPSLQRWLNRDSIGEHGGVNLYAAVQNRPVNTTDPFGLLTPQEIGILQAEGEGTSQLIVKQQAEIQQLGGDVNFWKQAVSAAKDSETKGVCNNIYQGLRAEFANANAELQQLQARYRDIQAQLAAAGSAAAATATGLYVTATGVFSAPTVTASFTGFGATGAAIAGGACVGSAAGGAIIGYGVSRIPVIGGGNVADFWGDFFYNTCPSCF